MTPQVWAVLLAFEAVGLWGQWMVGSGRWWGWLVVLGHSLPWFITNLLWGSPVAAAMAPLWWTVNGYNCLRWFRLDRSDTANRQQCRHP